MSILSCHFVGGRESLGGPRSVGGCNMGGLVYTLQLFLCLVQILKRTLVDIRNVGEMEDKLVRAACNCGSGIT